MSKIIALEHTYQPVKTKASFTSDSIKFQIFYISDFAKELTLQLLKKNNGVETFSFENIR